MDNPKIKLELEKLIALFKEEGKQLSKKQLKKLTKRARWNVYKPERKAREKEKKRRRKDEEKKAQTANPRKKAILMEHSTCKIRVAVDLSFGDLMNENELSKTVKQIQRCYSSNRHSDAPIQLYFTSVDQKIQSYLASKGGCLNWNVHYRKEDYLEAFNKEEVVYLSSESPHHLGALEECKVYIIGGLVDHNKHKGLSLKLAEERGISHAKLPIDNVLVMKTRKVLSIYHVFEVLLNVCQGLSWEEALLKCLPKRKCASLRVQHSESDSSEHVEPDMDCHEPNQMTLNKFTENGDNEGSAALDDVSLHVL